MRERIDAIDFLRSTSVIAIILFHIIYFLEPWPLLPYASNSIIVFLRGILNFSVITIVIVSGFSLSYSTRKIKFNIKNTLQYFKKRTRRIIAPWLIYIGVSILIYAIIALLIPDFSARIFQRFPYFFYQSIYGIPFAWIILKWIILLMVILSLLFPLLRFIYKKGKVAILILFLLYIASIILSIKYSLNLHDYPNTSFVNLIKPSLSLLSFLIMFVLGWSLVFIFGFYLEKLYFEGKLRKKITGLTIIAIAFFVIINITYNLIGLDTNIALNKTPPNLNYLIFGTSITLVILTIFYQLPNLMNKCKVFFKFFSNNSLWIFLWSYLTIVFISTWFFSIEMNIYLKLFLELLLNLVLLVAIIVLQKFITKKLFQ